MLVHTTHPRIRKGRTQPSSLGLRWTFAHRSFSRLLFHGIILRTFLLSYRTQFSGITSSLDRKQGKILDDDDQNKTKLSTFKPKALRNPKTYKNLEKEKLNKLKLEEENKTEFTTDSFGNKKLRNLKAFTESKSFQQ